MRSQGRGGRAHSEDQETEASQAGGLVSGSHGWCRAEPGEPSLQAQRLRSVQIPTFQQLPWSGEPGSAYTEALG